MKNTVLILLASLSIGKATAQTYQTIIVQDSIATNTHWTNNKQYLLKGFVYVTSGSTLTIDSGTIIKGDKNTKGSLIVERGAKIYANGTKNFPIIFTSNQPVGQRTFGDWGGVILCGSSPTNWSTGEAQVEGGPRSFYGGTNAADNSGKLSYVRIEFPGIAFSPNNEVNGLTLCGIGSGTQIDHIQISYSGDDSYEFFGGNVNAKYLVSYRGWDDDFDNDNGYQGKVQFGAIIRDPNAADQSGSKAFESDSYQTGTVTGLAGDTSKITKPIFSNITAIGPLVSPTSTAFDPQYVAGVHIRRGSGMSLVNSVIAGWPCGLLIDESSSAFGSTTANIGTQMLQFRNNIIAGTPSNTNPSPKDVVYVVNGARSLTPTTANADTTTNTPFAPFDGPWSFVKSPVFKNAIYATQQTGVRLQNPFDLTNPILVPTSTSPITYGTRVFNGITRTFNPLLPINYDTTGNGLNYNVPTTPPDFTNNKAVDPFFTKVNYIGAFAGTQTTSDNWMNGWCNFNPVNTNYDYVIINGINQVANGKIESLNVHPNPASQSATISFVGMNTNALITITDMSGKLVYNALQYANGSTVHNIDLSQITSGLYLVSVKAENGTIKTAKLAVVK